MKRLLLIAAMLLTGSLASGGDRTYKPVKVPIIPGVRGIAERSQAKRLKPYLEDAGGDILYASDLSSEVGRGGTNSAAALGNGGLSVQVSPWAELTVLRWPSPIHDDQLRYFTLPGTEDRPVRMDQDAPGPDWRRYGHPQVACENLGSRGGVVTESGEMVWLGDPTWTTSRAFAPEDSMTLVTTLHRPDVTAEVTDFVDPEADLLVRSFSFSGPARRFIYHGAFAPQVPDPAEEYDFDPVSAGFAARYVESDQVVVHFQPEEADPERGAFVAWGLMELVSGYQVGADRCLREAAPDAPLGGYDDGSDGELSGSDQYQGPVDSALSTELGESGQATVLIAAAHTQDEAIKIIHDARALGLAALRRKSGSHWQARSHQAHLPATGDAVTERVIRRSVLNVLVGQDRKAGAIVASMSRQPPYHFDYPRDGAFFDLTLDTADFLDEVSFHHEFLVRTQYTKTFAFSPIWMVNFRSPFFDPSGNWPQKISVDGSSPTNFLVNPCEIDETALTVWNFWRHEKMLAEDGRAAYREAVRDAMVRSADSLLDWIDVRKGWTRPATEDDSFPPDATLHGVSSTLTAMAAACDAGPRWGLDQEKTAKYCEAARALRDGLRGRSAYPETLDNAGFRGLAWSLWPAPAFDDYDEPGARAIKERLAASIRRKSSKEAPGFAYLGEEMVALAMADRERGEYRDLLESALHLLTHEVAFPGSDCYGEITVWGDFAGTGELVAQQRTAIPHIWNGAVAYLAAVAMYEPDLLLKQQPPAP